MNRLEEVSKKLKKMYHGSDEHKDKFVKSLKNWIKSNQRSSDPFKYDAIQNFLADQSIF